MRRTLEQIRAILNEAPLPSAGSLSGHARAAVYLIRVGLRIFKQWARDHCPQQAAALSFQSALSLVPILALAVSILRWTGQLEVESRLFEFLVTQVFPDMRDLAGQLQRFAANISTNAAGGLGLAFTFLACYALYSSVEKILNDIWRVGTRRPLMRKLLTFYALATLLPALAGFYFYLSGRLIDANPTTRFLGPVGIQFVALFLTNKLLPNTVVRWQAAFIGTVVTALALELTKWAFVTFAKQILLTSYTGVYGSVALIPMVLVWIYVSWLLVLLGVEIANTLQNLRSLEAEERRGRGEEPVNGLVAAQLLALVAANYERGGTGVTREALSLEFGLSPEIIDRIFGRLKARGLIAEVQGDKQGFIPGRSPAKISLADVLAAFRSTDIETALGATSPALASLIGKIEESRRAHTEGLTIVDILPSPASPSSSPNP